MKRSNLWLSRIVRVRFLYIFLFFCLVFGGAYIVVIQLSAHKASAATLCNSNSQFPLTASGTNSGACLGQVDNNLYSFELTLCSQGSLTFTGVTGGSLAPAPNGSYTLNAVNNCGDTGGTIYASQSSGNDQYGDPVSILVKANPACSATITISGVDQTTKQKGTATANPCDLISQFKSQGTTSFSLVYNVASTGTGSNCNADNKNPLVQSHYTATCVGIVDPTRQSFEFIVDTGLITSPTKVTLQDPSSALNVPPNGKPFSFTDPHTYQPGLTAGDYLSDPSGKDAAGATVGILVNTPCNNQGAVIQIVVADSGGGTSTLNVSWCDLITNAKTCNTWSFLFKVDNRTTSDFNFLDYNCGTPLPTGCDHPTPTKFDPYLESKYNRSVCVGRLSDQQSSGAHGLISADIIVTVENTVTSTPVQIRVSGANVAARILPCEATGCQGISSDQLAAQSDPFERIDKTRYHSGPVPSVSFGALYTGTCNLLDSSGCGARPDPNLYPNFSGTGIFADNPCDPTADVIVTATEPLTGNTGQSSVKVCDIIKNKYAINVTVKLIPLPPKCIGTGLLAYVLCPLTDFIMNATTFIEQTLVLPYLTVSPLSSSGPVFKLWSVIRNIANILLILVFFFIIFSQATSVGLSSYGVKHLLPRLAMAAVIANISYYLVAFAIDAFNIFGAGVAQLAMTILATSGAASGQAANPDGFWQIAMPVAVLSIGVSMGWIWSLLAIILLIILVVVVVLVLRQMLIIVLVIVSPLLAVADLLPNTQQYASKGWNALIKLLIMYPLIVFVFGIGNLVGTLLSSGDIQLANGQVASTDIADAIKQVFVALAKAAPLLLVPLTFAAAGKVLSGAHNALRQRGQSFVNRGQQAYQNSSYAKYRQGLNEQREQQIAAGSYIPRSRLSWINPAHYARTGRSLANRGLNRSPLQNTLTAGFGAQQALQNTRQRGEARSATQKYFNDDYELAEAWLKSGGNRKKTFSYTTKAAGEMIGGRFYKAGQIVGGRTVAAVGDFVDGKYYTPGQVIKRTHFGTLDQARQNTFNQMSNSGLGRSGDSFTAAMELVASNGRGNQAMVKDAFDKIRELNPSTSVNDIASLATSLRATYRKNGRGDMAGNYKWDPIAKTGTESPEFFTPDNKVRGGVTPESAWKDVSFENFTRHTLDSSNAPDGESSLRDFLKRTSFYTPGNSPERVRKIVEALPRMEARARERMENLLVDMFANEGTLSMAASANGTTVPVGGILPDGSIATVETHLYAADKAKFLDDIRQEFKLVPK